MAEKKIDKMRWIILGFLLIVVGCKSNLPSTQTFVIDCFEKQEPMVLGELNFTHRCEVVAPSWTIGGFNVWSIDCGGANGKANEIKTCIASFNNCEIVEKSEYTNKTQYTLRCNKYIS